MTNREIIAQELELMGEDAMNVEEVLTFAEWQRKGYKVNKGEKAFIQTKLWKPMSVKVKEVDAKGNEKEEKKKVFKMVNTSLFTINQVTKK